MALKQRLEEIRKIIRQEKKVVVSELSEQFGVTEETIRRDLDKLENEGLVARTYGGAVLNQDTTVDNVDFIRRAQTNKEEKAVIASLGAQIIPNLVTVSADASSTVAEVLQALRERPEMTVLTYSINAIDSLRDTGVRLISTGGIVSKKTCAFKGPITQKILDSYYTEMVLFSCKAINKQGGIYDSNEEEIELKKTMIRNGQKVVLFVDHSKFDRVAFVKLADFSEIDMLVTDSRPSQDWCDFLEEAGVKLICP